MCSFLAHLFQVKKRFLCFVFGLILERVVGIVVAVGTLSVLPVLISSTSSPLGPAGSFGGMLVASAGAILAYPRR